MSDRVAPPFTREEMDALRRAMADEHKVRHGFWPALKRVVRRIPFSEDLVAAYFCATDSATPRRVKLVLFGALGYFILPVDAIADFLPLVGFSDDAAVLAAAIATVSTAIRQDHRDRARDALRGGEQVGAGPTG